MLYYLIERVSLIVKLLLLPVICSSLLIVETPPLTPCPTSCSCNQSETSSDIIVNCINKNFVFFHQSERHLWAQCSVLVLDDNQQIYIDNLTTLNFTRLRAMSIRSCHLRQVTLKSGCFPILQKLDLSDNFVTNFGLKSSSLSSFDSVQTLNLNNNSLTVLMQELFEMFPNLVELNLGRNMISSISIVECGEECKTTNSQLTELQSLRKLVLSNNKLSSLSAESFVYFKSLLALDLSSNTLKILVPDTFKGLQNLVHLNLSFNAISFLPETIFDGLPNLKYLHLSHNLLKEFPLSIPMLEWLDMSHNLIQVIPEKLKQIVYPIEVLNIAKNPLVCNCEQLWLKELFNQRKYLIKHVDMSAVDFVPQCAQPDSLAGMRWTDLDDEVFVCKNEQKPVAADVPSIAKFDPDDLQVTLGSIENTNIEIKWRAGGDVPFASVFVQYYRFGQLKSLKFVELSVHQKRFTIKGLAVKSSYRVCVVPKFGGKDDGLAVMPIAHSHCVEAVTKEAPPIEIMSYIWIFIYYILGMLATVTFLVVSVAVTAFITSFFTKGDESSDMSIDEPMDLSDDTDECSFKHRLVHTCSKKKYQKHGKHSRHHKAHKSDEGESETVDKKHSAREQKLVHRKPSRVLKSKSRTELKRPSQVFVASATREKIHNSGHVISNTSLPKSVPTLNENLNMQVDVACNKTILDSEILKRDLKSADDNTDISEFSLELTSDENDAEFKSGDTAASTDVKTHTD